MIVKFYGELKAIMGYGKKEIKKTDFKDIEDLKTILNNVDSELSVSEINLLLPEHLKYEI